MNESESQILKNQSTILLSLASLSEDLEVVEAISRRLKEISDALAPANTEFDFKDTVSTPKENKNG